MKRRPGILQAFLCLLLMVVAASLSAQTTKTYRTLEARVQQAQVVVRGVISDLERKVIVPRMGQRDGTTWPDGIVSYTLTVAPQEILKGAPVRNLTLTRETSDYDRRFEEWQQAHTSF